MTPLLLLEPLDISLDPEPEPDLSPEEWAETVHARLGIWTHLEVGTRE